MSSEISAEQELLMGLGYCAFILILSYILMKFPPKKINSLYGYRTRRSMSNDKLWTVANHFSAKAMVKMSWYSFLVPAIMYLIAPNYNFITTVIVNTLLILSVYLQTESYLNKKFDQDGNPL